MLIVKVELHSAITGRITEIARMKLWNTGDGTRTVGNYKCTTLRLPNEDDGPWKTVVREGAVNNYPRLYLHVWNLIARPLASMNYGEPNDRTRNP